jgi:hypothetical protein
MKTSWLIGTFLLGLAAPVAAQRPTSAYTQLDPLRCEVLEQITEGASARWRCPGRGGIPLYLNTGDDRFDLDAGVDNEVWESLDPLNSIGPTVEWRLHGGRAVAIIYRLIPSPEAEAPAMLIVETIGRNGRPGCEIARVNVQRADANARARTEADLRAGNFRCGVERAPQIGR